MAATKGEIAGDIIKGFGANVAQGAGTELVTEMRTGDGINLREIAGAGALAGFSTLPLSIPSVMHMLVQKHPRRYATNHWLRLRSSAQKKSHL